MSEVNLDPKTTPQASPFACLTGMVGPVADQATLAAVPEMPERRVDEAFEGRGPWSAVLSTAPMFLFVDS